MIRPTTQTPLPEKVLRQVQQVQQAKQSRDCRYAWLVGATVLAVTMLVAMIVESQLNLFSHALRFGLTSASLAATAICVQALRKRGQRENKRLVSAAKDVDATYPAMEQRVSTLTSCEEDRLTSKQPVHPAMLSRLSEETTQIHQRMDPKPIVSHRMLKRPLMFLAAAGLVMLGMFVWDAPKTLVQVGRFWAPWSNLSTTKVAAVEADSVFARHEPLKLTAALSGRTVEEVEFHAKSIETSELSTTRLWPSTKDESVARFRQSKAVESFDYRFRAGDGQTDWHRATVADRPKIQDLTMQIIPPAYTGKSARTFTKLPKKIRVVAGSRVEVAVTPKANVRTARLVMGKTDWLPMEPSSEGGYNCSVELRQPIKFEVQLTELHGLHNRRPPNCFLQVVADQAPKVKILKPTKTAVLLPDETIDIHFKATDDHGIQEMALRVYTQREGEDQPTVHEVPIPIKPDSNKRKIKGAVALDLAQFDLKDGDTIRYEVRASDNFRPLEGLVSNADLQPMKGVKMVPAEASNNKPLAVAASSSAAQAEDNAEQVSENVKPANSQETELAWAEQPAQASTAQNSNSNSTPAEASPDPAASDAQNQSQAKPSASDMAQQNETPPSKKAVAQSGSAASSAEQADRSGDRADAKAGDKKPPAKKMADASAQDDPASNENKIQTARAEDEASEDTSDSAAIAQSDPSTKQSKPSENQQAASKNKPSTPSNSKSSSSKSQQANASSSSSQSSSSSSSSSASQPKLASKDDDKKSDPAKNKADPNSTQSESDPVQMAMRSLDVDQGQSSSSGQRQIKVDKYAGGFISDHRYKLEIAIAPVLKLLKESLANAGTDVRRVMNPTNENPTTGSAADSALMRAGNKLKVASEAVITLNQKTKNTPYAFVGLRLESIRSADVAPAWDDVRKAGAAEGEPRLKHSATAWNHINRALASLAKLQEKYEQVKRDLKRADDILKFKKMHRVFIENSLAMLNPKNFSLNGQNRKGAEFDLDEEYLKRLKEVMQMRQDMMAELARILADDPQLLRRYMNSMNERNWSVRDQLTLIVGEQVGLAQEVELWANASDEEFGLMDRTRDATEMHLSKIQALANRVADLQDEFVSWLPLEDDAEKGDAAETLSSFKTAGSGLTEIVADVEGIYVSGGLKVDFKRQVAPLLEKATQAEQMLTTVEQSLQRIARKVNEQELANNARRRLPKLQTIQRDVQQWAGKLELLNDDLIHEVLSVDQENRRDELLQYSVKIASLESQLVAALRNRDGQLPAEVASKTKQLQKMLDVELPAAQLTAAQTLLDSESTLANRQQKSIVANFAAAEQTFDEILQAIADELDKLPVEDPIASLLRDPTLDEILAQLENEQDYLEELGLSLRPSNLQILGGWGRGGGRAGGMLRQLMSQQQRMRNLSNQAYRNALARARDKNKSAKKKPRLAKEDRRWNLLASELGEDMLQGDNKIPPERYRSAIANYFEQISKLKNGQEAE